MIHASVCVVWYKCILISDSNVSATCIPCISGIHECGVNNGDCGGKSLCLVADGVTGVCSCSTLQGQLLGNTCIGLLCVHNFMCLFVLRHIVIKYTLFVRIAGIKDVLVLLAFSALIP